MKEVFRLIKHKGSNKRLRYLEGQTFPLKKKVNPYSRTLYRLLHDKKFDEVTRIILQKVYRVPEGQIENFVKRYTPKLQENFETFFGTFLVWLTYFNNCMGRYENRPWHESRTGHRYERRKHYRFDSPPSSKHEGERDALWERKNQMFSELMPEFFNLTPQEVTSHLRAYE